MITFSSLYAISHWHLFPDPSRPSLISHARKEPQRSTSERGPPECRPVVHSIPTALIPVMNPSYPSNSSPFPQHYPAYHHHTSTPRHSGNNVSSTPMAGQAPYAYLVHHVACPSFPHYSPYPQEIMMYAPPRPTAVHEAGFQPPPTANHSPVPLIQMSSGKRKCKPQMRA